MNMDDPWGSSPWADEIEHPIAATKARDGIQGNDARPKTPVKASSLGLEVKADSPWNDDDDDGFGEWAAVSAQEEVKRNGVGFDGAGDVWESRDTGDRKGTTTKDEFDGLSWNDDMPPQDDTISRFTPSLMPITPPILRQPSPDPWATETTLNPNNHLEHTPELEQAVEDENGNTGDGHLGSIPEPLQESNALEELRPEPTDAMLGVKPTNDNDVGQSSADGHDFESTDIIEDAAEGHDMGHESSRPSSSPSDQSHHDETLPESPRSSLDEEPKIPQVSQKVSSKIQELVEHFDGLARQEEEVVIEPSRSKNRSDTPSERKEEGIEEQETQVDENLEEEKEEEDEDDDDFGDFEEGQFEAEVVKRPVTPPSSQSQPSSSLVSKITGTQYSPRSRYVKKDFGQVEFIVDPPILDKFYSQSGENALEDVAVEKMSIKDTIPYDSFQSLEERKTWYRVSRYGSMRKHNSGDGDNYIRVTWPQSQIRESTLKTVGRWMEEDRISGRVVLGGGSKGSSIFGWNDPNAPPVPLASAFGEKQGRKPTPVSSITDAASEVPREWPKGLVGDRSRSKSRSPPKARRSSTKNASISENHKGSPQAPVAGFGWNTSPTIGGQMAIPRSKEISKAAIVNEKPASSPPQSTSIRPQRIAADVVSPVDVVQTQATLPHLSGVNTVGPIPPSNDNDDWGEMIASPVVPTAPALPPPHRLRHKKSQSLNGAFSPPRQQSPLVSPVTLQSARSHKSTMCFDDILVPKPRNSLDSETDPFPSSSFPASGSSFVPASPIAPSPLALTTTDHDPWASADFSFFDSPAPKPVPAPVSKPMQKAVSFVKAPPAPASPLRHGKTRQEVDQDEIVASIVRSLPDLSYMLRR